ncbi:Sodium/hydrogen exchanger 6 [Platanthera guangdongensis]|uniref:Sodium/hydrogen exchanger 6 n=1 Tax=Platanthera guangdongensis TaxID=2320717 RepID=A0ABR2MDI5_9ASPA
MHQLKLETRKNTWLQLAFGTCHKKSSVLLIGGSTGTVLESLDVVGDVNNDSLGETRSAFPPPPNPKTDPFPDSRTLNTDGSLTSPLFRSRNSTRIKLQPLELVPAPLPLPDIIQVSPLPPSHRRAIPVLILSSSRPKLLLTPPPRPKNLLATIQHNSNLCTSLMDTLVINLAPPSCCATPMQSSLSSLTTGHMVYIL